MGTSIIGLGVMVSALGFASSDPYTYSPASIPWYGPYETPSFTARTTSPIVDTNKITGATSGNVYAQVHNPNVTNGPYGTGVTNNQPIAQYSEWMWSNAQQVGLGGYSLWLSGNILNTHTIKVWGAYHY